MRVKHIFCRLLDPAPDTEDNLEVNPNNNIITKETPTGSSSDNSDTEEEVATPKLAVEEDVEIAETDIGTPRLTENDVIEEADAPVEVDVDIAEADIGTPKLTEDDVIEEVDVRVEEDVDTEDFGWKVPGGWFYFSKPGASSLYQTVQNFPGWKSVYPGVPWLYHRRWPVRPLLGNEVEEETSGYNSFNSNSKLSPSQPFYAFRKISH